MWRREEFPFLILLKPRSVVDQSILQECWKHEHDTDPGPDVDGLGVGHGGERVLDAGLGGGHRQQSGHPQSHTGGNLANCVLGFRIRLSLLAARVASRGNVNDDHCIIVFCILTHRLVIQPEWHPGHGDCHGAGHVHSHDEEGELPGEQHLDPETGVGA